MIKHFLRSFVFHAFAIYFVAQNIGGISYNGDLGVLALAGVALSLVEAFVRPILNLLLLPFNLITLGAFRWIVNVFTLYLTTLLIRGFSVAPFTYPGSNISGFIIPGTEFSLVWAYIAVSLSISIISSFLFWLVH